MYCAKKSFAEKIWKLAKNETIAAKFFTGNKYQSKYHIFEEKSKEVHNLTKQFNSQHFWDIININILNSFKKPVSGDIKEPLTLTMTRRKTKTLQTPSRCIERKRIIGNSAQMRLALDILLNGTRRKYSTSIGRKNVQVCCKTVSSQNQETEQILKEKELHESVQTNCNTAHSQNQETNKTPSLTEKEIKELHKQYPTPKNILNNVFNIVSEELKNKSYKLKPLYVKREPLKGILHWDCTYHLKWPNDIKFSAVAFSKQDASTKCALLVLNYLKSSGKLTKGKHPVLYDEEAKQKATLLHLHPKTVKGMEEIVYCYENEFLPLLVKTLPCDGNEDFGEDVEGNWPVFKETKRWFKEEGYYMANELVQLPISHYKDDIMKIIKESQVVVVKGEPGCGKSTRVPQYILESWAKVDREAGKDCRIVVTQPRRIAAISLAERVANERGEEVGSTIGYQVRLKSKFNINTGHVLYCTTGIMLRRLQSDPKLSDCTHIIIDEAHERDVNTDLLLNLLRRAVQLNPDLKLVIMSATIDAEKFQNYFETPSLIHIPGFTYPVDVNYLNENNHLDKTMAMCNGNIPTIIHEDVAKLIKFIHHERDEGAILCFLPGWADIVKVRKQFESMSSDMCVYSLHSRMQDSDQKLIFSKPPPGIRKVILATNIAETSVTIDDVVYVIDTGIQKEKRFDVEKGIVCIDNIWISKSSMAQRKGRAGRVKSGESFHLYPKAKYDSFIEYTTPEILRTSLTKIVLDSKVYSNNMKATEFLSQLLSPPETSAVLKAVDELKELELLDANENLTPLGRVISEFQLEPNLGKAMVNAVVFKCVTPIVDIVTLFSAETELFTTGLTDKETINRCKREFSKSSDHLSLMRIFEKWLEYMERSNNRMAHIFCRENNLVDYKLFTIRQLRGIHFEYLRKGLLDVLPISDNLSDNDELVKAVLLSGIGHVLEHRNYDFVKGRKKKSNVLLTRNNHKATISSESVNFKRVSYPSNYLLYINETRSNIRRTTTVRETSLISPLALLLFKNNNVIIEEVPKKYIDDSINQNDHVLLKLENTKLECICNRKQAEVVKKCKEYLISGMQYYILQMTKGGEYDSDVNKKWDDILLHLNDILQLQGIDNQ